MPGLNLRGGGQAGAGVAGFTATAASPPSMAGTTVTQAAYGTATTPGPTTARNGAIIAGLAGAGLLVFLWSSLPR
jgi:hypothetical protein